MEARSAIMAVDMLLFLAPEVEGGTWVDIHS